MVEMFFGRRFADRAMTLVMLWQGHVLVHHHSPMGPSTADQSAVIC